MNYIFGYYLLILLMLNGCSVGPKYVPPTATVPATWSDETKKQTGPTQNERWWRHFHDPLLNQLIEKNSFYNINLKIAQERINIAQAGYLMSTGSFYPKMEMQELPPAGTGTTITQLLALTASIDPDLFGRLKQTKEAANANRNAATSDYHFALMNLRAEIATSYLTLRETQSRQVILKKHIQSNKQVLELLVSRYRAGKISYIDIAQQKALIETQSAEKEQNRAAIMALIHKIELLTGQNPGALNETLSQPQPVPNIHRVIHLGLPSELLRRRPDIIAAEQKVAAAHANMRVAIANLYPQLSIGWLLGWQIQTLSQNINMLQNPESAMLGSFNALLFDLSNYRAVEVKKREKMLVLLQYQLTIMSALHEVETQYGYYNYYKKSINHLKKALEHKEVALILSKDVYKKGVFDFNTILSLEQTVYMLENAYLHTDVLQKIATIQLYTALGGGVGMKQ